MSSGPVSDRPLSIAALSHRAGVFLRTPTGECFTLTPEAARETLVRLEQATLAAESCAVDAGNVVQGRFRCVRPFAIWRQSRRSKRRGSWLATLRLVVALVLAPVLIAAFVGLLVMAARLWVGEAALRDALPLCLIAAVVIALGITWLAVPLLLRGETREPHGCGRQLTLVV